MRVFAAFLAFSVAGLASASAQSLADVARQEGARRQTVATGKSYSDQDLKPTGRVPAVASSQAAPDADAASPDTSVDQAGTDTADASAPDTDATSASDKTDKADNKTSDVKDEKYWSKRMASLREQLERDKTFQQALQSRIDALTTDFVNRDDPAQRGQIAADRQKTLAELDRLRKAVEADTRAIPELEDEARRSGVPAGWLR
jgi:hypothetical protein